MSYSQKKYIAPLRARYPLVAGKGQPAHDGQAAEAIAARNVVDGLTMWRTQEPFAHLQAPPVDVSKRGGGAIGDGRGPRCGSRPLDRRVGLPDDPRKSWQWCPASATMAQGVRPPDPQIARAAGGITLTHRVEVC